jgi:hypothetical protein
MRIGVRSPLMSAQGRRPLLEIECCGSRFDKNLTSSRSAESLTSKGHFRRDHRERYSQTVLICSEQRPSACLYLARVSRSGARTTHASEPELGCSHEPLKPFISP